jgi:hypothetical protein
MPDFGQVTVTGTCPVVGCGETDDVRVFGNNAQTKYYNVKCSTCNETYTIKVVFTVSGAVTNYELT